MVERLFLAVPRGCLQFVIVVFPDHTHLLFLLRSYQMDSLKNIDFWVRGTNTLPTPNMTVNKLGRYEHILFTAHDYNIFAPLSSKIYRK